ncbi:ABC transporter ATP-binding protein [Desulfobacter latus]|uniref:ABC transporter ATP-binding protein n=1 Tax=Desulfobacter latus TaxID=2292 RepID=A0A850TAP5_9BACT|nr:ATP-binding cassette domain-containing protein [Desulfobacter latus]NWH05668.1 ABC transporter ATP-binding protein [Desulfobacter latus]
MKIENTESVCLAGEKEKRKGKLLISIRNVGVIYNRNRSIFKKKRFEALKDVSFDIFSGESIGVIGRNGAGKSTLMTLISGIIKPDRGEVINYGASVSLLALQAGFMNELSGRDNMVLSGLALGFPKKKLEEKLDEIISFSGIGGRIDDAVRTYSAGMRARLGFSIAHILNPDILLVDETLGVGDRAFRQKSANAMREKIKSEQTVVLVSHNSNTIRDLCDRAVWLEKGIVMASGEVDTVLKAYEKKVL